MFFKKKILGIDVGSHTIKIIEVDGGSKSSTIMSFAMISTPPDAMHPSEPTNNQVLSKAITQLIREISTKRKNVAITLLGSSAIVKKISLPKMGEDLVAEQIRWEAEQYIPYDLDAIHLDYKILNTSRNPELMDLLLIAAPKDKVFETVELIELSGLQPEIIDVAGLSLANCYLKNYGASNNQRVGLLNVGASYSSFVVIEGSEVIFCRDLAVGGSAYTQEIMRNLGLSQPEAEALKVSVSNGQPGPDEIVKVMQASHELVMDELNSAFDFFSSLVGGDSVKRLFITGGGSRALGLKDRIKQKITIETLNPFLTMKANTKRLDSKYLLSVQDFASIAVGVGVRQSGDAE